MNVNKIITNLYEKISKDLSSSRLKAELYFSLIQIKSDNPDLKNFGNSIYIDAKQFITFYINSIEGRDLGYDIIDTEKIYKCIKYISSYQEQLFIATYTNRLLKGSGFEDESKQMQKIINRIKTQIILKRPFSISKYPRLILHLSTYSIHAIILSVIMLYAISLIVLLPSPNTSWQLFYVNYHIYSDNFILNHCLNVLSSFFSIENDFIVETGSVIGILAIITIKLIYIVFIVNYLYKKIIEIIINN